MKRPFQGSPVNSLFFTIGRTNNIAAPVSYLHQCASEQMEGFTSHYERHASYSDMSPNYEQLKLHHLHLTKLHKQGDERAWLPAFLSNTCKIDSKDLRMLRQAL